MAKQKVRLADNIARVIFVDPDATVGATLGTDVFLPDGEVASPATLREYLGLGGENGLLHSALDGLQVGNDHPQYPMKAAREKVTGQWDFTKAVWGANGTAAAPEFTFTSDTDTGMYRAGADQLGLSTAGVQRVLVELSSGSDVIRLGTGVNAAQFIANGPAGAVKDLVFQSGGSSRWIIRSNGTAESGADAGSDFQLFARTDAGAALHTPLFISRATGQIRTLDGSVSVPQIAFTSDTDTGLYLTAANSLGVTAGGALIATALLNGTTRTFTVGDGTNGVRVNFNRAAGVSSDWAFQSAGVDRWYIRVDSVSEAGSNAGSNLRILRRDDTGAAIADAVRVNRDTGQWLFEDGTAALPELSFSGDTNTGVYRAGADILGFTTGGTLRNAIDASGRMLLGGAATASVQVGTTTGLLQMQDTAAIALSIARYTNDANPSRLSLGKSRGAALGATTIVQSGDVVGAIEFPVTDGTDFGSLIASVRAEVDGTPAANDTPGRLTFRTTAVGASDTTEHMRLTTGGQLVIGHTVVLQGSIAGTAVTPKLQLTASGSETAILFSRFVASTAAPFFQFGKSRSNTLGNFAVVLADDVLGRLSFAGADGTDFAEGARIEALVDGTPGSNDMPGRLSFMTSADGSQSPTERMRISAGGEIGMGRAGITSWQLTVAGASGVGAVLVEDTAVADASRPFGWMRSNGGSLQFGNSNRSGTGTTGSTERMRLDSNGVLWLLDGVTAPGASVAGMAGIYVDTADGDLKIRFADGTVKTIVTDT